MNEQKRKLDENTVRVIKISKQALFEFIYENFIDNQEEFLDVDTLGVTNAFDINFERGEFVFCAYKSENEQGKILSLPEEIDLRTLMANIPDTTLTMYDDNRYKEYTKEELIALSKVDVVK